MWDLLSSGQYIWWPLSLRHTAMCTEALPSFILTIFPFLQSQAQMFPWWQGHLAWTQAPLWCFWWSADCGRDLYRSRRFAFLFGWQSLEIHNQKKTVALLVKILVGHKMFIVRRSLPASSFEGFGAAASLIGSSWVYPHCTEHKNTTNHWNYVNEFSVASCEAVLVF